MTSTTRPRGVIGEQLRIRTTSAASTGRLAAALVACLNRPACFALRGPLGSGKTTFVRGVVRACGSMDRVKSPTFALAHTYHCSPPVHHLDLYRLADEAAVVALGLEELIDDDTAFRCVEWAERFTSLSTAPSVIDIEFPKNASRNRIVTVRFSSASFAAGLFAKTEDQMRAVLDGAARGLPPRGG